MYLINFKNIQWEFLIIELKLSESPETMNSSKIRSVEQSTKNKKHIPDFGCIQIYEHDKEINQK